MEAKQEYYLIDYSLCSCIIGASLVDCDWLSLCVRVLSCVSPAGLCATPWTVAHQTPLSMEFSRQEYWSGLPFPSSEDLPYLGIEPAFLMFSALAGGLFTTRAIWEAHDCP